MATLEAPQSRRSIGEAHAVQHLIRSAHRGERRRVRQDLMSGRWDDQPRTDTTSRRRIVGETYRMF